VYADLYGAAVWDADLDGANLVRANLSRAFLMNARLGGANLGGADLSYADLGGADLKEAKHLTQEQLEETTGDEHTRLPSGLKPPAHWDVKTDEQPEGG
jgi:uncharacterized protein YjbI with pentapeptide repeats